MNTYLTLANLHTREKPIGVCTFRLRTGCLESILSLSRSGQLKVTLVQFIESNSDYNILVAKHFGLVITQIL